MAIYSCLVVWNHVFFMTFHILGIMIRIDELIFFRGVGIPPTRTEWTMGFNGIWWYHADRIGLGLGVFVQWVMLRLFKCLSSWYITVLYNVLFSEILYFKDNTVYVYCRYIIYTKAETIYMHVTCTVCYCRYGHDVLIGKHATIMSMLLAAECFPKEDKTTWPGEAATDNQQKRG